MSDLYPEPPHLTVAVYNDRSEIWTFMQICDVVAEFGCAPLNLIEVAPAGQQFDLLSDFAEKRRTVQTEPVEFTRLVNGYEPTSRVLKAGFEHQTFGLVVVEYLLKTGPGLHPIGISTAADWLGIPDNLWSEEERSAAYGLGDWSRELLESVTRRVDPLYGGIGVEYTLPSPSQLHDADNPVTTELYVSYRLLDTSQSLGGKLADIYTGGVEGEWSRGIFYSGWAPCNSRRISIGDPESTMSMATLALMRAICSGGRD